MCEKKSRIASVIVIFKGGVPMIDFSSLPTKKKAYGGKNGSKLSVVYQGELYMLKFPSHFAKNPKLS